MLAVLVALVFAADDPAVAAARFAGYASVGCALVAAVASIVTNRRLGTPNESIARKVANIERERERDRELLYLIARHVGVPVGRFERRRTSQEGDG